MAFGDKKVDAVTAQCEINSSFIAVDESRWARGIQKAFLLLRRFVSRDLNGVWRRIEGKRGTTTNSDAAL